MRAFAASLDAIPLALAENSGLAPIETLSELKSRQVNDNDPRLGVDCMNAGVRCVTRSDSRQTNDMKACNVYDPLVSKRQQLLLATQLVRAVLKIDDVVCALAVAPLTTD